MTKGRKTFVYLLLSFVIATFLLGCARGVDQPAPTGKASITVKVNVLSSTTNSIKNFEPRIATFVDDLAEVVLTVKDQSGQSVYTEKKTEKKDIQFSFTLEKPGNYTFLVEGFDTDENKLFSGQVTREVIVGQNNVIVIDATFEPGTLRTTIEIDDTVWQRYNVEFAQLVYKKDTSTTEESLSPSINEKITVYEKQVIPGMWNVKFNIRLKAKDQWTTPSEWQPQTPPSVSVPVKPSRIRNVKFIVRFDSERNEPEIVPVLVSLELPYAEPVQELSATWNKTLQKLTVTWKYSGDATFYVYKEIEEASGSEIYQYYELVGTTTDKTFEIVNYTTEEHDRISGIAVNAVVNGKESGLVVLKKTQFSEFQITVSKVENLAANYDGSNLKITWSYDQPADKYKIYKKLETTDYELVAEVTTKEANVAIHEAEYNNLKEIAVSVVYSNVEGDKQVLPKSSIVPFDGGDGSEASPYLIRTAWQLQRLNDNEYRNKSYYFKLVADIDLTGKSWTPIGTYSTDLSQTAFQGVFDGNGYKIKNLNYNDPDGMNVGLFGYIYNSTVKNLIIENANIRAKQRAGALSGASQNSTIEMVKVIDSSVRVEFEGSGYAGGLIGDATDGTRIRQCVVLNSTISGKKYAVGGLIGQLKGTTTNPVLVENSYVQGGEVKSEYSSTTASAGFICNYNIPDGGGAVRNNYAAIRVTNGQGFVGYIVTAGNDKGASGNYFDKDVATTSADKLLGKGVEAKSTSEMKQQSTYVGWDFVDVWKIDEGNDYPRLKWEP